MLAGAVVIAFPAILKALFLPLASLWRWLTADPIRMAFAVLLALCGFLALRLSMVDGDRDEWRDKARAMIAAAKELERADAKADAAATVTAAETKGKVDAEVEKAREAARQSDDPLGAVADSLREQGSGNGD